MFQGEIDRKLAMTTNKKYLFETNIWGLGRFKNVSIVEERRIETGVKLKLIATAGVRFPRPKEAFRVKG